MGKYVFCLLATIPLQRLASTPAERHDPFFAALSQHFHEVAIQVDVGIIQGGWIGDNATTVAAGPIDEGTRRLLVNAAYWCTGLEDKMPEKSCVEIVGEYEPSNFGFGKFVKGIKPADLKLE